MERIASQLRVDHKGQTLIGKPGERIQFGCSNRIRHTLAPDNSSLTFATSDELLGHWLCVLSFEVQRDWTWDGLADQGIEVRRVAAVHRRGGDRRRRGGGLPAVAEDGEPRGHDRPRSQLHARWSSWTPSSRRRTCSKPATAAHPFPNTIDVSYTLTPRVHGQRDAGGRAARGRDARRAAARHDRSGPGPEDRRRRIRALAVPAQPRVLGDGGSRSAICGSSSRSRFAIRTTPTSRACWPTRPIRSSRFPTPISCLVRQDDPPLAIDPELIRVITHGHGNDNAGLDAMQAMTEETADPSTPLVKVTPVHYLLPLPPGLHAEVAGAVRLLHLRAARGAHEPDLVHGAGPLRASDAHERRPAPRAAAQGADASGRRAACR